jgi:hypothetical protein
MTETFNLILGPPERKYCVYIFAHYIELQPAFLTPFTFSVGFAGLVRSVDKELRDAIMYSVPKVWCPFVIGGLELQGMTGLLCHLY